MRLLTLFAPLALCSALHAQWVPPIGIPDPADEWGVADPIDDPKPDTTTHCPGWHEIPKRANSIAAGDDRNAYYVDNTHPSATDTGNTYGHPDLPRLTPPLGVVLLAGDYMEIHGDGNAMLQANPYTTALRPRGEGTEANPIWIVGVDQPQFTAIDICFYSSPLATSYIIIDGLYVVGGGAQVRPRYVGCSADHIAFRNCVIDGTSLVTNGSGFSVGASAIYDPIRPTTNIVFYNGRIGNFGDKTNPGEECGVYPSANATGFWVVDSEVHDNAEDGFAGSHGGEWSSSHYYVGRCNIHSNVTNAVDIKGMAAPVVFSECKIHNHYDNPFSSGGGSLVVHYSGDSYPPTQPSVWNNHPEGFYFLFNEVYDTDQGFETSIADDVTIVGNVFRDIQQAQVGWDPNSAYSWGAAIHMRGLLGDTYIAHNTFYNCSQGFQCPSTLSNYSAATEYFRSMTAYHNGQWYRLDYDTDPTFPTGVTGVAPPNAAYWTPFELEIVGNIFTARNEPTGRDIYFSDDEYGDTFLIDNNLIYTAGGENISYGSASIINGATWTRNQNGSYADPLLNDPANGDYSLQAGSPAIDSAIEGAAYALYNSLWGENIEVDYLGNARPYNTTWDMGAVEAGATPPVPGGTATATSATATSVTIGQ